MSNVLVFTPRRSGAGLHHRCPYCGDMDAFCNVIAQQYGYCEKHRVKWHLGANLTDDWLQETTRDWVANRHFLDGFDLVYSAAPKQYTSEQA
jgi:hypothetical protein